MDSCDRFKIGVFGSAGGSEFDEHRYSARIVGQIVATSGNIICTGACPGLPHEAAVEAHRHAGIVLGYSPAMNRADHVENFKFPAWPYILTFTGMEKKGRNLICSRTCDAGIFISGRWGTLNEFTLMYDEGEGKVIGLLAGSGGFVDSMIIPAFWKTEKPTKAITVIESNPIRLMNKVLQQVAEIRGAHEAAKAV